MKKRKPNPSQKGTKSPAPKSAPAKKETPPPDEDQRFDFGGLPDRDLKKNLGCG